MTLRLVPLERLAGDAIELLKGMMGVRCCVVGVAIIRTSTLRPGSATVLSIGVVRLIVTIVQKRDWNIPASKYTGLDKQVFERKIVKQNIAHQLNISFGCSKNRLIKIFILSTHKIFFG